jgi:molybdenum cofactor biosynthesis protein B
VTRRALVLTISDGVHAGVRVDRSGDVLEHRLRELGFDVDRALASDDVPAISAAIELGVEDHHLIISTGGTGLTPRDVTPQATRAVLDYEVPGIAEAMRAAGRAITPLADLSRGVTGVRGRTLIVNVPGSPTAARESLTALELLLDHALETLTGPFDHGAAADSGAGERRGGGQ